MVSASCFSSPITQTNSDKIFRVYRTPEFLHAIGPRSEPTCARCGNKGTLIHPLWQCPKLQRYWMEEVGTLNELLDVNISVEPLTCLLRYYDSLIYTPPIVNTIRCVLFVSIDKLPLSEPLHILLPPI